MRNKNESIDQFNDWLSTVRLSVKPSLKINHGFNIATVVVDFGTPKEPLHISADLNNEIFSRMKELAQTLTGKRSARVSVDNQNGIYWTSV